jgi:hypothetical protein
MEVSGQLHIPAALSPGKDPWYPLDRRVGGPQSLSGRGGEEKNFQPLPGLEPPYHPARSPALYRWAITTRLKENWIRLTRRTSWLVERDMSLRDLKDWELIQVKTWKGIDRGVDPVVV